MKYCFGVDVGGTTIKLGLFTEKGEILDKWEIKTRKENHAEAVLPDIAEALEQKLQEKAIDKKDVCGIGIGLPAPVTKEGVVMQTANLGWGYKEVRRELEELSGMKVAAGNDANMAALGEMWLGAGGGADNMLLVTLGTGVGGGAIVDGRPLVGANGASTEIGHICVNYKDLKRCGCGKTGCLEQYASATGIVRLAKERLAEDDKPTVLRDEEVSAKTVFDALKAGDEVAEEIVEKFGYYLGHGLADAATILDPKIIVIGGGVSKAGEIMIPYIRKYFLEKAFFANLGTEFQMAELGNDAGICGAAKLILDSVK
ncbi:ROK family glucokinase [Faecalicatena contorta]|uniref:ROK family glucokinase n=1 Tax=Faecalicatena contorta TaxID=39482 RepID=UPI001F2DDACD|nr:ROK family glucokinase [Faecalicatena contorta]MCF2680218.1 ROK family glucokinase [Faecalicatena contorta]